VLSIIIPSHDRPHELGRCLAAVADLEPPGDAVEVIVVEDGESRAPLEPIVASYGSRLDVTLLKKPHAGPAAARNHGAARARGRHLAFLDDDCVPSVGWLRVLMENLAAAPGRAVGGRIVNALPDNPYSSASHLVLETLCESQNGHAADVAFLPSSNLVVPSDGFRAIGGFDCSFACAGGEDRDFCDRWRRHGYGLVYAPDAVVCHWHFLKLTTFWRQHFHYGRGAYRFRRAASERSGVRVGFHPLRFYSQLVRNSIGSGRGKSTLTLAAVLALSQLATATGYCWQGINGPRARRSTARRA
jgi:GT2 family glycosyltransferase